MARGLTERQHKVLEMIARMTRALQMPPTITELAEEMGMAVPSMHEHLGALERKGYVARDAYRQRSLRLLRSTQGDGRVREIPILGRVSAGAPLYAEEHHEGTLHVDAARFPGEHVFALRVRGRSMVGAGILPKDLVIVREQDTAQTGDIVVAFIGDEATVKRFRKRGGTVQLEPENPDFEPREFPAHEVRIAGKVIGVHRVLEALS